MILNFKHSASIEQFLADEMAPSERAAFRKELRSNPDLAQELKFTKSIDSALERDDIIELRKKLIAVINANRKRKAATPVIRLYVHKWWYAAASLLILCTVATAIFIQSNRNISNDSLFSQYYNSENILDQTRGDQNILDAMIKFQQKDFATASVLFKNILNKDKTNIAVWFYYGISNIETNHYEKSIEAFNSIIKNNDNLYVEHAEWYLGLCYLKSNMKDKAIEQFMAVASNPENFHRKEAKDILEKMKLK
jgi:tetratricopeptide (TPR) repeat protein